MSFNLVPRLAGFVTYLTEVRSEVRKVTWPGWDDLRRTTFVIIVVVIILGIVIGLMDLIFAKILINFIPRLFS